MATSEELPSKLTVNGAWPWRETGDEVIVAWSARLSTGTALPARTAAFLPAVDGRPTFWLMAEFRSTMPWLQPLAPGTEKLLFTRMALPPSSWL